MPSIEEWVNQVEHMEYGVYSSYNIQELIGVGGFSNVFRVLRNDVQYALKEPAEYRSIPDGTASYNQDFETSFRKEALIWARLSVRVPDCVVRLLDYNTDPHPWMVMELADRDLSKSMEEGDVTIDVVIGLLRTLQKIHDQGIVHRDIKPGNILRVNGVWKFSDFGLSKNIAMMSNRMATGTPEYMAPEQCLRSKFGETDFRTDIWQMGIIAYKLISGSKPYPDADAYTLSTVICNDGPDLRALPDRYRSVMSKALSLRKEDRFASALEFADALEAVVSEPVQCVCCGSLQPPHIKKCSNCGVPTLESRREAESSLNSIRRSLGRGMVLSSEKEMATLKAKFPYLEGLDSIERSIAQSRSKLDSMKGDALKEYSNGRYYAGMREFSVLLSMFPDGLDDDGEAKSASRRCHEAFDKSESLCRKALNSDSREERARLYASAFDTCPDNPTILSKLSEIPPAGIKDAKAVVQDDGTVRITFENPDPLPGASCDIYRRNGSLPKCTDEFILARDVSSPYIDSDVVKGVGYHYVLRGTRDGMASENVAVLGPVVLPPEVEDVKIWPLIGGLHIKYVKPERTTRVRIWRADEDHLDGEELDIGDRTEFDDIGLQPEKKYHYLFVCEFNIEGKLCRSDGVAYSCITPPEPINDLRVVMLMDESGYQAIWNSRKEVSLYQTPRRVLIPGSIAGIEQLEQHMTRIKPLRKVADGVLIPIPQTNHQYIYPVITQGNLAIVGKPVLITHFPSPESFEYRLIEGFCHIWMGWPGDTIGAEADIKYDDMTIPEASFSISREDYNREFLIPLNGPSGTIKLRLVYKIEEKEYRSKDKEIRFDMRLPVKIRYRLKHPSTLSTELILDTDPGIDHIPSVVLVLNRDRLPLNRDDGVKIWESEGSIPLVNGHSSLRFLNYSGTKSDKGKGTVRLFFMKDEDYDRFAIINPEDE